MLRAPIVVCNDAASLPGRRAAPARSTGRRAPSCWSRIGRNTAPAIALAAMRGPEDARRKGEDPVLLVLPADHVIRDVTAFQAAAVTAAERGGGGEARRLRRRAAHARDGLRLHPSRRVARRRSAHCPVRRKADASPARRRSLPRAITTGTAACSCSARRAISRSWRSSRRRSRRPVASPSRTAKADLDFTRVDRGTLRGLPERLHRLRGDGEDVGRRRRAARCRLERCRVLGLVACGVRLRIAMATSPAGTSITEDSLELLSLFRKPARWRLWA